MKIIKINIKKSTRGDPTSQIYANISNNEIAIAEPPMPINIYKDKKIIWKGEGVR